MTYRKFGHDVEPDGYDSIGHGRRAVLFEWGDVGKVIRYSNEGIVHFTLKSMLVYELSRLGHRCVTEARIDGVGRIDVYDIDTRTAYELESEKSRANSQRFKQKFIQAGVDGVVVPINGKGGELKGLRGWLREWWRED